MISPICIMIYPMVLKLQRMVIPQGTEHTLYRVLTRVDKSDVEINGPTFVPESTNLGQGLPQKVGFFLIFEPILRAWFFDKMLVLSNKKSTFVLASGFFGCCIFFNFVQILLEMSLFS